MAEALVTQVRNPYEDDGGGAGPPDDGVELDSNVYISTDADPNTRQQNSGGDDDGCCGGCWSALLRKCCGCCGPSSSLNNIDKPASRPVPVQPRVTVPHDGSGGKSSIPLESRTADVADEQKEQEDESSSGLLPPMLAQDKGRKTLVLDLDETLVHSSFRPVPNADFVISIELEGEIHHVYVMKRPGVDQFLEHVSKKYEVVVFTASLAKYADPLLDILDPQSLVRARLFREACVQHYGNYVKDLSLLGRNIKDTLIIDNASYSYMFQPDNAIGILSWFNDPDDTELAKLLPMLDEIADMDDVRPRLREYNRTPEAQHNAMY